MDWRNSKSLDLPKLKFVISGIKDGTHGSFQRIDDGFPLLSSKNVHYDGIRIGENESQISEEDHYSIIKNGYPKKGDLLLTIVGTIGRSCVYELNEPYSFQRSVCFLRPNSKLKSNYLYYCSVSKMFLIQLKNLTKKSTQGGVYMGDLKKVVLPLMETDEQTQIVSFLDTKTQKIDELIEKTEQKIELLKEKRTSLINHCVTKGLNPNVEMKDSGVEWIGEIPRGWVVKKVKYLLNDYDGIKIGPFGSSLKLDTLTDSGIKIYGQGNIIKDDFQLGHRYLPIERFEQDFTQYEILDGDILVTMMGTTGKSKVFSSSYERGILDSHLLRLRFNKSIFSGYLFSILLEQSDYIFQQIKLNSKGSIMEGLNSSIIKELKVLTPPLEEQNRLLEHLEEQTQTIDSTIEKETQRTELLKEYRQSLISEVVTGKIDVRDYNG